MIAEERETEMPFPAREIPKLTAQSALTGAFLGAGLWVALDMFASYKITDTFGGFAGLVALISILVSPYYISLRRAATKCAGCGANWSRKETARETIRRYRRRKDDEFETEEYWQIWTCQSCGDVTRRKHSEYNPDGHLAGD